MNSIRYATWPLIATLILTLSACGSETPEPTAKAETAGHAEEGAEAAHAEEGEDAGPAEEEAAEPIKMDAAAMTAAGIRIAKLDKSALNEELRAPGGVSWDMADSRQMAALPGLTPRRRPARPGHAAFRP